MDRPSVRPGEWIEVDGNDCVVTHVYEDDSQIEKGMLVFDTKKPTTHESGWDSERWVFSDSPDFDGYARETDPSVRLLKRGRYS